MSHHNETNSDENLIQQEAAAWIAKVDRGRLKPAEEAELREWLARSPRHAAELRSMSVLWDGIDDLLKSYTLHPDSVSSRKPMLQNPVGLATAIAAMLAVVLISGFYLFGGLASQNEQQYYSAAVGEKKTISLQDGSTIILNTDSQVQVRFNQERRTVRLLRGEAHFDVAHDKSRPFLVMAGTGVVRAVGTSFNVYLKEKKIEVTVTEGRVALSSFTSTTDLLQPPSSANDPEPVLLTELDAGQAARFENKIELVETVPIEKIDKKLSWRTGLLIFEGDSLNDVIHQVGRYTAQEFVISDPELRNLKISGYFKTGEIETLLSTLEQAFDIKVVKSEENQIYLFKSDQNRGII